MNEFLIALQFLTRLPVPRSLTISAEQTGRSTLYYPLVGLLIGALLWLLAASLAAMHPLVSATVLLSVWVLLTGALHLDGLADSADAWMAGGDREQSLKILRDTHNGVAAVVAVVLILLIKFSTLVVVLESNSTWCLLILPTVSRAAILALLLSTPYARERGLADALQESLPRSAAKTVVMLVVVISLLLLGLWGLVWWLLLFSLFIGLRQMMLNRIGGFTGDTIGALVEILEAGGLLLIVMLYSSSGS